MVRVDISLIDHETQNVKNMQDYDKLDPFFVCFCSEILEI